MVTIPDIDNINHTSPYKVKQQSCLRFTFHTDFNVRYVIDFAEEDILDGVEMYQFSIVNINNQPSPSDSKVRDTVLAIVNEFFQKNQSVLLYICETSDGKQRMRDRLFRNWFSNNESRHQYIITSASIMDSENVVNYAAIILRSDHPEKEVIIDRFNETIQFLSNKPE